MDLQLIHVEHIQEGSAIIVDHVADVCIRQTEMATIHITGVDIDLSIILDGSELVIKSGDDEEIMRRQIWTKVSHRNHQFFIPW